MAHTQKHVQKSHAAKKRRHVSHETKHASRKVKATDQAPRNVPVRIMADAHEREFNARYAKKDKGSAVARIKVVGIGGGGGNALTRMSEYFPRSVELIAINTDVQDLEQCQARKKIYIGKQSTKGLGAGMNPELGRQAAEENREEIAHALSGADMVFLTAGFGGGTGSGATPVVAEIAQELGILTAAIITKPFSFEGVHRAQIAQEALAKLKDRVDTYITVSNDKIFSIITKDTSLARAFEAIDDVLKNAVLGITEIIITPGIINVDFADIQAIIQNSGPSIIGVGVASGKERALAASAAALHSPLLESSIDGARGVLFSISGRRDVTMNEINDIAKQISENTDPSAKIIFGTYYDKKLNKGQLKVTLIATGFGSSYGKNVSLFGEFGSFGASQKQVFSLESQEFPPAEPPEHERPEREGKKQEEAPSLPLREDEEGEEEESIWDIPAFLRKKGKNKHE